MEFLKLFNPLQPEWNEMNVQFLQMSLTSPRFQHSIAYVYKLKTLANVGNKVILPGIPDGCIDLLFNLDGDYSDCLLIPSPKKRKLLTFKADSNYLGIRLFPLQTLFTFQASLKEINNEIFLPLFTIAPYLLSFYEKILHTFTLKEHILQLETFLSTSSEKIAKHSTIVTSCINEIFLNHGNLHVKDLEGFTGYSERYLRMLFQNDLGIAPKTFLQLINFQYIVNDIVKGNFRIDHHLNEYLYYDTSHFYKTFKKFTSMTPIQYQKTLRNQ
ncbi:helix-turn-helix domain-containing protein [Ureibacillus sp. GCM10028918]|uniref:helix-turn-helix domain-containing protein n=1 Tax=Ureibacillus sp. GCM10028918 TaxID=3273429 RepID=UPI00361937CD